MRHRVAYLAIVALWVGLCEAQVAEAHMRDYLLNQQYYTAKQGEFEVEFYNDMNFSEADNADTYNSKHQVEVEYGITDHLSLAYYEVYTWDRTKDWERDEFKLEAKYRFAEAGQWPVDLALYTEYKNPDGHRDINSDELENKVILSKDFGPWNVIGNFVFEKKLNTGSHWEYEYTAGISYALTPRTRLGVELKQGLGDSKDFAFNGTQNLQILPGIYTNPTPNIRILVGPAFGLTRTSDDLQLRSIVEVEF